MRALSTFGLILPSFAGVLVLFLFPACGTREGSNLLLITVDTLRADRLGAYGYKEKPTPHMDHLAEEGILFTRAFTPVPVTGPAHAALLTGRDPVELNLFFNGQSLPAGIATLAELLKRKGLKTGAFVSAFPLDSRFGFSRGFSTYDDETSDLEGRSFKVKGLPPTSRKGEETVTRALAWLGENCRSPFFLWIHLWDPHRPYMLHPEDREEAKKLGKDLIVKQQIAYFTLVLGKGGVKPTEKDRREISFLYDSEVGYVDRHVGRLVKAVGEWGISEKTLIVLTGDHGEALGEHGYYALHTEVPYEVCLRVPLILAWPSRLAKKKRIDTLVSLSDLAPALVELLFPEEGSEREGSLAALLKGEGMGGRVELYHQSLYPAGDGSQDVKKNLKHIFRGPRWKYIFFPREGREELFDWEKDAGELEDLSGAETEVLSMMRERLQKKLELLKRGPLQAPMDREVIEALKSLGYYR